MNRSPGFTFINKTKKMKITKDEVLYVAKLARLELQDAEVEKMTIQLDTILSYVAKLDELDTEGVTPATHMKEMVNAFREDETQDSLERKEALKNCADQNGEAFVVPKIIN